MSSINDEETEIFKIIKSLTTSRKGNLDEQLLKRLKVICKGSSHNLSQTYYALITQLRKEHSEIRYNTLLIINELFLRSSLFRKLLENDFKEFIELVVETDPDYPLPLPKDAAKILKCKGLEFIQNWATKYGQKHRRISLALSYLKECKRIDFNDLELQSTVHRDRQLQEQQRQERFISEKINKIESEMQEISEEIDSIVTQTENCFRLLIPHPTEFFTSKEFEDESSNIKVSDSKIQNDVDSKNESDVVREYLSNEDEYSLRSHGLHDFKSPINIQVKTVHDTIIDTTSDTLPIIENLNDLHGQISRKYLPLIIKWLKILTKGSNCTDMLKKAIDLKNLLEVQLEKYKELKINPQLSNSNTRLNVKNNEEEDDDFEEVPEKEGYEAEAVPFASANRNNENLNQPCCSKNISSNKTMPSWKLKQALEEIKDPTSSASTVNVLLKKFGYEKLLENTNEDVSGKILSVDKPHKAELLSKAPILPYDIDLFHWEEEKPLLPQVVRYTQDNLWQVNRTSDDENEQVLKEQLASLRTRKIEFSGNFEPVKWSCRAPLPNGKLCPRKDRFKCPFHGKIIKRDSEGKPVENPSNSTSISIQDSHNVTPDWQDPKLLADIEAETGVNLKMPQKRKAGGKKIYIKKPNSGLTDIKTIKSTARDRISKKILKRYKHCAAKLDEMDKKKFHDKFGDQWNYY